MISASLSHRLTSVANARLHWRAKASETKRLRRAIALTLSSVASELSVLGASATKNAPVEVTCIRYGKRLLDDDNLASAFKAVRDEVALGLGLGDSPKDPVVWRYAQHTSPQYSIRIEIRSHDEVDHV